MEQENQKNITDNQVNTKKKKKKKKKSNVKNPNSNTSASSSKKKSNKKKTSNNNSSKKKSNNSSNKNSSKKKNTTKSNSQNKTNKNASTNNVSSNKKKKKKKKKVNTDSNGQKSNAVLVEKTSLTAQKTNKSSSVIDKETISDEKKSSDISKKEIKTNEISKTSAEVINTKSVKKNKNKRDTIKLIILIILTIVFLFLSYRLYCFIDGRYSTRILNRIVTEIETGDIDEVQEDMKRLYNENNDLVGFIVIPGTKIKYPVVYTQGKDYYINKDFNKKPSLGGTLYIDKHNTVSPRDTNLIIHGHNMYHDGTMFNDLHKFKDENFYLNHKTFTYYTLKEKEEYEIVSVFLSKVYLVTDQVFKYYKFYNADTIDDFNYYKTNIMELNMHKNTTDIKFGDQFLTLSTCEYSQENGRLVIVAKKINNN